MTADLFLKYSRIAPPISSLGSNGTVLGFCEFFKNMVIKGPNASGTSVFLYTPASIVCTLDEDE